MFGHFTTLCIKGLKSQFIVLKSIKNLEANKNE